MEWSLRTSSTLSAWLVACPALLAIGISACSSSDSPASATCSSGTTTATEPNSVAAAGENVDDTCASVAGYYDWKSGAPGASCTGPLDCSPVCVSCPNGAYHALSSWCDHGVCASTEATACMVRGSNLHACGN